MCVRFFVLVCDGICWCLRMFGCVYMCLCVCVFVSVRVRFCVFLSLVRVFERIRVCLCVFVSV